MNWLIRFLAIHAVAISVYAAAGQAPKLDYKTLIFDYPAAALRGSREGIVYYSVIVANSGKVKSCSVTKSSGHADLDDEVCKMMRKRVRFTPALDANGKPIEGVYDSKFSFRIPR